MDIKALRLANAGAKLPCPKHPMTASFSQSKRFNVQCQCVDGWVYALPDTVRVLCPGPGVEWYDSLGRSWRECYYRRSKYRQDGSQVDKDYLAAHPCPCDKRGWVPAMDGWVWQVAAAKEFGVNFWYVDDHTVTCVLFANLDEWVLDKPGAEYYDSGFCEGLELAFHTALHKALGAKTQAIRSG